MVLRNSKTDVSQPRADNQTLVESFCHSKPNVTHPRERVRAITCYNVLARGSGVWRVYRCFVSVFFCVALGGKKDPEFFFFPGYAPVIKI